MSCELHYLFIGERRSWSIQYRKFEKQIKIVYSDLYFPLRFLLLKMEAFQTSSRGSVITQPTRRSNFFDILNFHLKKSPRVGQRNSSSPVNKVKDIYCAIGLAQGIRTTLRQLNYFRTDKIAG